MHEVTRRGMLGSIPLLSAIAGLTPVRPAMAAFPDRPAKLVIPFAPGGGNDALGRIIAEDIAPLLGQPVVVENRVGAGGIVGLTAVARAPADGYTLGQGGLTAQILVQGVNPNLPFDPLNDFVPIVLLAKVPLVLVAARHLNVSSVEALVRLVRAEPGRHNFSSAGIGASGHIAAQHFSSATGLEVTHVPYRGSAAGLADLLAGRVSFLVDVPSVVAEHARSGALSALAILNDERLPTLPNVPTMREAGFPQVQNLAPWQALLAPKGTPADVVAKLNSVINAVLARPETRERLARLDFVPIGGTPEQAVLFFREESERWVPLVRAMNLS